MSSKSKVITVDIDGQQFPLETWYKLTKTKYESFARLDKAHPKYPRFLKIMNDKLENEVGFKGSDTHKMYELTLSYYQILKNTWDEIPDITAKECFAETNTEKKRVMFAILGTDTIYNELKSEILDTQVLKKVNTRWVEQDDGTHKEERYTLEDKYVLRRIKTADLGIEVNTWRNAAQYLYAVQCWCTSTGREFNILTDATHQESLKKFCAIEGIVWTILTAMKNPTHLMRQGDVIVAVHKDKSKAEYYRDSNGKYDLRPITKKQYLELMHAES